MLDKPPVSELQTVGNKTKQNKTKQNKTKALGDIRLLRFPVIQSNSCLTKILI